MIVCHEGLCEHGRAPLTSHVCDIPRRLKAMRPTLFVMIDVSTGRIEIHDSAQRGGTLACVLPYPKLDARALTYVQRYRRERLEETAREIDEHNARLERRAMADHLGRAADRTREAIAYLDRHSQIDRLPKELMDS